MRTAWYALFVPSPRPSIPPSLFVDAISSLPPSSTSGSVVVLPRRLMSLSRPNFIAPRAISSASGLHALVYLPSREKSGICQRFLFFDQTSQCCSALGNFRSHLGHADLTWLFSRLLVPTLPHTFAPIISSRVPRLVSRSLRDRWVFIAIAPSTRRPLDAISNPPSTPER